MSALALRATVTAVAIGLVALALPAAASAETEPVTSSPVAGATSGDVVRLAAGQVIAPPRGQAVAISIDRVDGPSTTRVVATDALGVVTVSDGMAADAHAPEQAAESAPAVGADKCSDSAFSFINGASWNDPYEWRFRASTTPNGLSPAVATHALKKAVNNITEAHNKCGMADEVSATAAFRGTTTSPSDVSSTGGCGAPNMQNVTEFGPLADSGVLAITCVYSAGPNIVAASVRINTSFDWRVRGRCTTAYGIAATMTHEYGHAFGLGHVDETEHRNLTMSSGINSDCSNFESWLGRGDVLALRTLY